VSDTRDREAARRRSLRWIESLWEGRNTTAREDERAEEVLEVFREVARRAGRGAEVREYAPEERRWRP
jgi:hypothetical protein